MVHDDLNLLGERNLDQIKAERDAAIRSGTVFELMLLNILKPQSEESFKENLEFARGTVDRYHKKIGESYDKVIKTDPKSVINYLMEDIQNV
jgi:hypothetical protein